MAGYSEQAIVVVTKLIVAIKPRPIPEPVSVQGAPNL